MRMQIEPNSIVHAALAAMVLVSVTSAQMEKRDREGFERRAFEQQAPALGAVVDDLLLQRIDGRPWSLGQQLGKTIVLVKASYT
jgi:hypothetical protein